MASTSTDAPAAPGPAAAPSVATKDLTLGDLGYVIVVLKGAYIEKAGTVDEIYNMDKMYICHSIVDVTEKGKALQEISTKHIVAKKLSTLDGEAMRPVQNILKNMVKVFPPELDSKPAASAAPAGGAKRGRKPRAVAGNDAVAKMVAGAVQAVQVTQTQAQAGGKKKRAPRAK